MLLAATSFNSGSKLRTGILRYGPIKLHHFGICLRGITAQVSLKIFLVESACNESPRQFDFYRFIFLILSELFV